MSTSPSIAQAFDAHAEAYDRSLVPLLAVKDLLHRLMQCQFSGLPESARILVVGAGTAAEARFLAPIFPGWQFTLVDPSEAMLAVGRRHAVAEGFADRCTFHTGLVSSLGDDRFDAATSVLVSHFLTDAADRQAYFGDIATRLKAGGLLFNADLCADTDDPSFGAVMEIWLTLAAVPDERQGTFRAAFGKGLAVHRPAEVEAMIARAGFSTPTPVFQAALIRGWAAALR